MTPASTRARTISIRRGRSRAPDVDLAPREPAARGLLRLLAQEVSAARDEVAAVTPASAAMRVHRARKRLKKARTIVRLLRPVLGGHAALLASAVRRAAHALAGSRDATVLADTADAMARRLDDGDERAVLVDLAAHVRTTARHDAHPNADLANARAALAAAAGRLKRLRVSAEGEMIVRERVAATYRKARKLWRVAEDRPEVEVLHDWRKRVKDRLHVVRLFSRRWPEPIGRREAKLDRLGEILGHDHDLALLDEALPRGAVADRVRGHIATRRRRLAEKAFQLAGEVFAEKPNAVAAAWDVEAR